MTRRLACRAISWAAGLLLLGACASAPADRYFVLDAGTAGRAAVDLAFAGDLNVRVNGIPQSADRPQIVVQRGANELDVRDADRWAEPLRGGLERCLIQDLRRALPGAWVSSEGLHRDPDPLRLVVEFTALDALADGTVRLRADWTIVAHGNAARRTQSLSLTHRTDGSSTAAIVAAWSDELDELAQGIGRSVAAAPAAPGAAH
jgi:uncharacterized lipoprotein YmbA